MSQSTLPPELQDRINNIINDARNGLAHPQPVAAQQGAEPQQVVAQPQAAQQPQVPAKPPSLVEHVIMLRHEMAALSQQVQAIGQVVEASANATAHIYSALHGEAPGEADY